MVKKSTERVNEWRKRNPERKKEQDLKAALKYIEKNKDNPEFIQHRRELNKESMKRKYYERKATMSEEELIEYRKKRAADMRAYRAKKKAEAAAQAAQNKGTD